MNGTYGLLVGVSSGGRFRLPSGDILWAVDNLQYRALRSAENPGAATSSPATPPTTPEALTAWTMQLARRDRHQHDGERREGAGNAGRDVEGTLAAVPAGRLPDYCALAAGQVNEKGQLKPIPLDASFRDGLSACNITQ